MDLTTEKGRTQLDTENYTSPHIKCFSGLVPATPWVCCLRHRPKCKLAGGLQVSSPFTWRNTVTPEATPGKAVKPIQVLGKLLF